MATTLDDLRDRDKLVSLTHVQTNAVSRREMYLTETGQRVYVSPEAFAVSDFIVGRPDLVPRSKLMLIDSPRGMKGAPVFGISFERALSLAGEASPGFISKSMFKAMEDDEAVDYARCTTLLAHVQKTSKQVQLEVWQRLQSDSTTFYLHGLLSTDLSSFHHIDGATMHHTSDEALQLFVNGNKVKGTGYQKWFRIDGEISVEDAKAMAMAFLPCDQLVREYIDREDETPC